MRTFNNASTLPMDFCPGESSIIIGRGRLVKNHSGNKKFDHMIAIIAKEYHAASCKAEKGAILSQLMDRIHSAGPGSGFIKKDPVTGLWVQVDESLARTTAAQAIRNYLHSEYRSSKQFKQKRRLQQIRDGLIPSSGTSKSSKSHCVSPDSSDDDEEDNDSASSSQSDTFGILFDAFGSTTVRNDDPFTPTPILVKSNSSEQLTGSLMGMEANPIIASPQHVSDVVKPPTNGPSPTILDAFFTHSMSSLFQV